MTQACRNASMVVLKTVTWGHDTSKSIPFLKKNPHVKMVEVIRDPRSIYASMMRSNNFWGKGETHDYNPVELTSMCDDLDKGLHVSHPHYFRVVYEQFVAKPEESSKAISSFVAPSTATVPPLAVDFLKKFVNSKECKGPESHFTYCRSNSTEPTTRYQELPEDLSSSFSEHASCRRVSNFYKYPLTTPAAQ
mmetsp:Transcript_120894/g.209872  ORF Transcript_120894/g.209872 Transcript_120894/m.209872 type:complete len:192 (+) Transcript_120894:11-586(+)